MTFDNPENAKRRDLANYLATLSNILWAMQHRPASWDEKIAAIQKMQKNMPRVLQYMIYLKNKDEPIK